MKPSKWSHTLPHSASKPMKSVSFKHHGMKYIYLCAGLLAMSTLPRVQSPRRRPECGQLPVPGPGQARPGPQVLHRHWQVSFCCQLSYIPTYFVNLLFKMFSMVKHLKTKLPTPDPCLLQQVVLFHGKLALCCHCCMVLGSSSLLLLSAGYYFWGDDNCMKQQMPTWECGQASSQHVTQGCQ